jgi:hypothetical protein
MKITTWLAAGVVATTAGVIVATAATGCTVEATSTGGTAGTGGTGGSGGSTGGSGGSTGGTGGDDGGTTGGTAGTGGAAGTGGTAGNDGGGVSCTNNPNTDPVCNTCSFKQCNTEHCACNAVSTCRGPMMAFYMCVSMPANDPVSCATTFATNANVDGSGAGLANDLAGCLLDKCTDTCQGKDASTLNRNLSQAFRAAVGHSDPR